MYRSPSPAPSKNLCYLKMVLKSIIGGIETQNLNNHPKERETWNSVPQDRLGHAESFLGGTFLALLYFTQGIKTQKTRREEIISESEET